MEPLFSRILIPFDASASALKAARYGLRLAYKEGCEVWAMHVVDAENAEDLARYADQPVETIIDRMTRSGEGCLDELRNLAREQGIAISCAVRVGSPHRVLLQTVDEIGIDLIVMGTVGRRGPRRVLIGSVTERIIAHSPVPVLVVK